MKTFREYVSEKYGHRAAEYSKNVYDMVIYDILHDKTFPDNEQDGLLVRSYIHDRQPAAITRRQMRGNEEMVNAFESLWILWRHDQKESNKVFTR